MIALLLPVPARRRLQRLLERAGLRTSVSRFVNRSCLFALIGALVAASLTGWLWQWPWFIVFIIALAVLETGFVTWLVLRADARIEFIEGVLPDALDLMSANLRAGLSTDRALLLASRPEFGPLQDELDRAGREVALGKSVPDALKAMASRIGSARSSKTIDLIVSGIASGGKLAELLTHASKALKQQDAVQKKIASAVTAYIIFIATSVLFGAPFLFATSAFLVETLTGILGSIETGEIPAGFLVIAVGQAGVTPATITTFAVLLLATVGVMASLVIGQVSKGKARQGLAYAPFLVGAAIGLFFLFRVGIASALGAVFG